MQIEGKEDEMRPGVEPKRTKKALLGGKASSDSLSTNR